MSDTINQDSVSTEPAAPAPDTTKPVTEAVPTGAGDTTDAQPTLTQDQVNAIVERRLADDRRRREDELRAKYGDLDALATAKAELDAKREAEMSELERLQKKLADAETARQTAEQEKRAAELAALRLEIGQEVGLPAAIANRLRGDSRETMLEDANLLKAVVVSGAQPARTPPDLNVGVGSTSKHASTARLTPGQQSAARSFGMTDEEYIEAQAKLAALRKG